MVVNENYMVAIGILIAAIESVNHVRINAACRRSALYERRHTLMRHNERACSGGCIAEGI